MNNKVIKVATWNVSEGFSASWNLNDGIKKVSILKVENLSDHYLCIAEIMI